MPRPVRIAADSVNNLGSIVEFKRHFPLIADHAKARECVRIISGWRPLPDREQQPG